MQSGGLHTPRPHQLGILRSPHTPGTGSSVRFGMRTYEDGEESLLTASVSSTTGELDAENDDAPRDVSLPNQSDSLDMSFTESFLRREVDGALAGLDDSGTEWAAPLTPARPPLVDGQATARPPKAMVLPPDAESTSPMHSPMQAHEEKLAPSSPTIRASQRTVPSEAEPDKAAQSPEHQDLAPSDVPAMEAASHDTMTAAPAESSAEAPAASHEAAADAPLSPAPPTDALRTSPVRKPRDEEANPFESPTSVPPRKSPLLARSTGADSSLGSSSTTWGTPRGDASMRSAKSAASPSAVQWPGMYEFSYLTEKNELDEVDTGPLVPYPVEALSTKLFSIDKLDHVDARELLDMVVALDRTHTQRTLFLQHRLARSHHLTGLLRASLEQAQSKNDMVETCVHEFLTRKAAMEAQTTDSTHHELRALTAQLEERLEAMHGALHVGSSPSSTLAAEREALAAERRRLETERRDLEVRLAERSMAESDHPEQALEAVRAACAQDADVRVLQAREEAADEIRRLRAELAEARAPPSLVDVLEERLHAAAERERTLEAHVADLEWQLSERASQAPAAEAEKRALIEARSHADVQCHALQTALEQLRSEREELEAELKAQNHALQQRIRALENDVSRRDLELVQLQSQRERLEDESLHFSLALAAKDQELQMLKRGTQGSMYWQLLTQRDPARSESRKALGSTTNRSRTTKDTLARIQRVLHADTAPAKPGAQRDGRAVPPLDANPVFSLASGTLAGAVEGFATYPIEYTKTVSQFSAKPGEKPPHPFVIVRQTVSRHGLTGLYSGCGALVAGNALKAGVRFLSYDHFKDMLKDEHGKLTAPRSLLAGLGAGMMEAIFAVTPSETIKTKLIDDAKRETPKYPPGLVRGSMAIVRDEGVLGIYRGLVPVMLRQGANSAVRFGTYSTLRNFVQNSSRPGQPLPGGITFGIGAVAGIVTVYATMPLDVVKTRMQALDARQRYTGTFDCMRKVFQHEGILAFWRGATPRLARLMLSGGIVFTVYEKSMDVLQSLFA